MAEELTNENMEQNNISPTKFENASDDTQVKDLYEKYKYLIKAQEKGEVGVEYEGPSLEELDNIAKQAEMLKNNTIFAVPSDESQTEDKITTTRL